MVIVLVLNMRVSQMGIVAGQSVRYSFMVGHWNKVIVDYGHLVLDMWVSQKGISSGISSLMGIIAYMQHFLTSFIHGLLPMRYLGLSRQIREFWKAPLLLYKIEPSTVYEA